MTVDFGRCLNFLDDSLWERAVEVCKPLVLCLCEDEHLSLKTIMPEDATNGVIATASCMVKSIVSDLNSSLQLEAEQIGKLSHMVIQSMLDGIPFTTGKFLDRSFFSQSLQCELFSNFYKFFQQAVARDPQFGDVQQQIIENTSPILSDCASRICEYLPWPSCFANACPNQCPVQS